MLAPWTLLSGCTLQEHAFNGQSLATMLANCHKLQAAVRDIYISRTTNMSWRTFVVVNTLRPKQNGRHFADDIFRCIFFNDTGCISIDISLNVVPKGQINNIVVLVVVVVSWHIRVWVSRLTSHYISALVQIMAWRRPGDKPWSEPVMVSLPTHICVIFKQQQDFPMISKYGVCNLKNAIVITLHVTSYCYNDLETGVNFELILRYTCSISIVYKTQGSGYLGPASV